MTSLQDEVFNVTKEISGTRLSFTIIGGPNKTGEDPKPVEQSMPVEEKKSLEDYNSNHPTRDTDDRSPEAPNVSSENDGRKEKNGGTEKQKYSSMSAEVCFIKDRPVLQKRLAKKIDVRYAEVKQNIRSSCMLSCDQKQCPAIKERLNYHKKIHHSGIKRNDNASGTRSGMQDKGITVSPTLSRMRLPKFALPLLNETCSVQTDISMRDFSPNRLFISKPTSDDVQNEIPLRKTETRDVLPKRNFYKEYLQNEVLDWLRNVPMFFSLNFTSKDIKDIVVFNLVDKIDALTPEVYDETYETKTKLEIDNSFNKLPIWLHGTRQEQLLFKDCLKEKLWNKIKGLNKIFLGVNYEEDNLETVQSDGLSYEKEIIDWSLNLLLDPMETVTRRQVVDLLMKKLSPLLEIRLQTTSYKLILKGEIINILDNLPLTFTSPRYKTVQLNKLAEDLANRLLNVQLKKGSPSPKNSGIISPSLYHVVTSQVTGRPMPRSLYNYKNIVLDKVGECLDKVPICNKNYLKKEICSAFLDSNLCKIYGINVLNEISQFIQDTGRISMGRAQIVANMIIQNVNEGLNNARSSTSTSFDSIIPKLSRTISVYRWGSETPPATSTPKKAKKKDVPKLNPEETTYLETVAALVNEWMNTLPKQFNEDPGFKNTVVYDLAGDILDHQKLQQLAPDSVFDKEKYQKYLIYKWLCKFSFFEESRLRTDSVPLVAKFQKKLNSIPVPNLTAPHHGTRQEMGAIKHMEAAGGWDEDYVAKGIDVLEDQISVWVNEQPPDVIANKDKGKRNKMVHDLALNLQDHLRNKNPESVIEADIDQWLQKMVNPKEKEHIKLLTQDLKDKIIELPQDRTLEARHDERHRDIVAKIAAKRQEQQGQLPPQRDEDVSNLGNIQGDPDKTIREFIGKFIEHNYDIDDPLARGAFAHLLKTELRKLTAPTRKEVYEHFEQAKEHQRFRPDSLNYELEYIKVISDWLNGIPIEPSYNTVGNKRRIEFINDLARNILEIEEQRNDDPDAMDYNYLLASTILTSMNTYYDLPIPDQHLNDTPMMAHRLLEKLVDLRPAEVNCQQVSQGSDSLSSSIIAPDIKEQNLSDFINDYIRINGRDIADDELKLEAWTARLLKEIKKMVNEGADPETLTKAQVYEKFAGVPIPTEESVETFGLKLHYVKEITDWMKNLPLLPMPPEQAEQRIQMISELAEKMCDTEAIRRTNGDNSGDKPLEEYISSWISQLPLDKNKEINKPILIQQLMSRMTRDSKQDSKASVEIKPPTNLEKSKSVSITSSSGGDSKQKVNKKKSKEKDSRKDSKKCSMKKSPNAKSCKSKTPAEEIIEAIETWSNKLTIKLDDKETVKTMKEGIARQLYQKIGELNVDPRIFNDELLYREMLDDEIETQLENVPQNSELQNNREEIKEGLINQIINTNQIIKEKSAGDNYRHKLETTIDSSIPNPVQSVQAFDPGFEIYKNHLADMFILENFDHANDDVKAAHEKRVKHEIDKYFQSAQNKNAVPLTKDQIYNEIYSALFKVPMPQENAVADEVEQVKTRCEIDAWYEKLPIQPTDNLNELLERDQILSTLAKRIQEIEKYGCSVDDNINKETRKWLEKLPLKPGQQGIDDHVKQLQNILKSTAEARKYVPPEAANKGKSKLARQSKGSKGAKGANTSQVPGPSGGFGAPTPPRPRSSVLKSKATTAKPCCPPVGLISNKKPGDLIVEVVEEWCDQLPLISTEENNKDIKNNVATRIIIQISELNADAEIFNDDIVYDELLDDELDSVLSNLPVCCDFEKSKAARKYQLKEQIKAIKPLIKEEKARQEYKQELHSTVASILKEPHDTPAEKLAKFNKLKEEIVENFVQYYYNVNDEEAAQFYKLQIHDAVLKFCHEVREQSVAGDKVDPMVRRNQLLCELQRIPVPQTALREEVAEIKMKKEVEQFLREQSIPEGDAKDAMTRNLAKRLCDIEKSGYSPPNEKKMNADILRGVTKLKKDVSPEAVDGFVIKLKLNQSERNAPPMTSSQASNLNQESPVQDSARRNYQAGAAIQNTSQTPEEMLGMQRLSPMPPRMPEATYHTPVSMHAYGPQIWGWSPNQQHPVQKLSRGPVADPNFRGGNFLCSSPNAPRLQTPAHLPNLAGPMNLNKSLGSAVPSSRLSQQVLNRSCPQSQQTPQIRGATSGPMIMSPTFGQTPRQVRQGPTAAEPTSLRDTTSDSLFDEPLFNPVRYSLIEPFKSASSGKDGVRKLLAGLDPRGIAVPGRPKDREGRPKGIDSSDEEELCICDICAYGGMRRRIPYCLMPMDSFEDCLGFPIMYGMPFPDCFYY